MEIAYRNRQPDKPLKTYIVTHPVYGQIKVERVRDRLRAVQAAAKAWGLQWSKIARECDFKEVDEDADLDTARR